MRATFKIFISSIFILLLTGCIAEDYDFTPPTLTIINTYSSALEGQELEAANINWNSDRAYLKETKDLTAFASAQKLLSYAPEERMDISLNNQDFLIRELNVYVIQNNEEVELLSEDLTFILPEEVGEYVLKIELITENRSSAEYVGNIVIEHVNNQNKNVNGNLPGFTEMNMPYAIKIGKTALDNESISYIYNELCWNSCDNDSQYQFQEVSSSNIQLGDELQIDWHHLNPQPSEINLLQISIDTAEVVNKDSINVESPFKIEVDEANTGMQYALEFIWKEEQIIGRSILNFKLK